MKNCSKTIITSLLVALLSLAPILAHAQDPIESIKIQFLITSVETLEGAKFIRNGAEYDALAASKHLRLKLRTVGDKVKTAEDFINFCASKSSLTGAPYMIKFADGTTVKSETFFRKKLKAFTEGKS